MNTIFIDVIDFESKSTNVINKLKEKILKVSVTRDFASNRFTKNIFLKVDSDFLKSSLKRKHKINETVLKLFLKKEYKNEKELFIVFSKEFDNNNENKNYLKGVINNTLGESLKIHEVIVKNDMLKHDTYYIDNILNKLNKKINKANVLIVINNIQDFNLEKVVEYIQKYRYVDVLYMDLDSKVTRRNLLDKINNINDKYGTTIEIIQRRNISEYDIYVLYSSIELNKFQNHYILNSEAKIIDIKNEEQDTLSLSFRTYNKNKYEIEALFNRIDCSISRFSKNKLGNMLLQAKNK